MPKRVGNLFDQIVGLENCEAAILEAARHKKRRRDVAAILDDMDSAVYALHSLLIMGDYRPSPYREKTIKDGPSGKERVIQIPAFWPDQCVHHALMRVLIPVFERRMYYWSCGSMPGRGGARAQKGVKRATLSDPRRCKYTAKLDIKKCYASIDGVIMKRAIARVIKDQRVLALTGRIVDSCAGLPIGNYTSSWFCNLLLTPLDMEIKQHMGVDCYVRYMDDMVMIGPNKRKLHRAVKGVRDHAVRIGLQIHDNWAVFKVRRQGDGHRNRPIDFVGMCFCAGYTTMRKRNALAIMRQSRRIRRKARDGLAIDHREAAGFVSRVGAIRHCDAWRLYKAHVAHVDMRALKGVIQNESKRRRQPRHRTENRA